jgi:myosin V
MASFTVVHSNPVLESFGNARTLRNDNSSRFGKFLDVRFHTDGRLKSASIQTYLLEKVRLVAPGFGERNYHIFYELLAGLSPKERNEMGLADRQGPRDFHITAVSGTFDRRDGVEDRATYRELRTALTTIGISDQETKQLFSVCCAILHCSNINFLELPSGASDVDPQNPAFRTAINLMGVAPEVFSKSLCYSSIEAGGEVLFKTLTQVQAAKALEGLIKATYTAMFQRLVDRINLKLSQPQTSSQNHSSDLSIGVLDIFGFESFDKNSFEQLCINYCNEALQQQFNQFVFKQEQAEYEKENINWEFIAFPDNQDVLDLIEKRHDGILSILDEQNLFPRCTDQTLARAIYEKCSNHPRFSVSSNQKTSGDFCIDHYAGIVEYSTATFLEKNRDELPKETTELLQSSNISFIASLGGIFANSRNQSIQGDRSRTLRRMNSTLVKESVGSQFSGQLRELREKIAVTSPHYVRCLKPNDLLVPGSFSSSIIAEQLRYAGVLEVVRVSRFGFSQRYPHLEFISRYQILAPNRTAKQRRNYDPRDMCEKVVTAVVDLIRQSETKSSQDILNLDKGKR